MRCVPRARATPRFVPEVLTAIGLFLVAPLASASEGHAAAVSKPPVSTSKPQDSAEEPSADKVTGKAMNKANGTTTADATAKGRLATALSQAAAAAPAAARAGDEPERAVTLKTSVDPMEDPMDRLRRRLAERLGAEAAKPNPNVVQVVNKPLATEGESVVTYKASTPSTKPRPVAPKVAKPAVAPKAAATPHDDVHTSNAALLWGYEGEAGPDRWAQLKPEYAACGNGKRQSPIDIRDGIAVQLDPVQFHYQPSAFSVVDNGHTVQVDVAAGNTIEVMGRSFELQEFHFHRPSEERLNGQQFDMVVHLTHKDTEGRLAVVAVLLDRGSPQPAVQAVWNNLPLEKGDTLAARAPIDLNALLPTERSYYTYMGSLTQPPCSEGVLWMVMKQPVGIAPDQIGVFARLYAMNARPLQEAAGRLIKGPR